ncbi:hypothetical protein N431DRAFT_352488 [Stipitochalara longipes BDJ]|nr:hypothetical protein N431DRAFT_352488 [Stipitochalara longipes BDJ]
MSCQGIFKSACPCYFKESYKRDHILTENEKKHYYEEKKVFDAIYEFRRPQLEPFWKPESEAHWIERVTKLRDCSRKMTNPFSFKIIFFLRAANEGYAKLFASKPLSKRLQLAKTQAVQYLDELTEKALVVENRWRQQTTTFRIHAINCDFDIKLEQIPKSAARESECMICRENLWDFGDVCKTILDLRKFEHESSMLSESEEFPENLSHSDCKPQEPRCVQAVKLRCGHTLGFYCLEKWLLTKTNGYHVITCPCCRAVLAGSRNIVPVRNQEYLPANESSSEQAVAGIVPDNGRDSRADIFTPITASDEELASASTELNGRDSSVTFDSRAFGAHLGSETITSRSSWAYFPGRGLGVDNLVVDTTELEPPAPVPTNQLAFPQYQNGTVPKRHVPSSEDQTGSSTNDQAISPNSFGEIDNRMGGSGSRQPAGTFEDFQEGYETDVGETEYISESYFSRRKRLRRAT